MAYPIEEYPYTDVHEMNMDWVLKQLKAQAEKIKELEEAVADLDARVTALGG